MKCDMIMMMMNRQVVRRSRHHRF